jgi:HAD superfamily hydrolase (TIGR01662 family)
LHEAKAFIFEFIGTLTSVRDYSIENSKMKVHKTISDAGFNVKAEQFLEAYSLAHEKYRKIRYEQLVEVTNAVWIAEALKNLGVETAPGDTRIRIALNAFFEDYVDSFELRPCAKQLLTCVSERCKIGLISNFTYAPVIYAALRRLGINQFFNAVLVSEAVGWRKPHAKIFEEALRKLDAKPDETVYVGDSPLEDIKGAKALGMKTVFVPSQFYSLEFLHETRQKPDLIVTDLCELNEKLPRLLKGM